MIMWRQTLMLALLTALGAACQQQPKATLTPAPRQTSVVMYDSGREDLSQVGQVRQANDVFYAAVNQLLAGNVEPMWAVWSHSGDVTMMGPFENVNVGWDQVADRWRREGQKKLGGQVMPRDLVVRVAGDVGYVLCVEAFQDMAGEDVPISIRATNIFRKENGQWKLIHHHTDTSPTLIQMVGE